MSESESDNVENEVENLKRKVIVKTIQMLRETIQPRHRNLQWLGIRNQFSIALK